MSSLLLPADAPWKPKYHTKPLKKAVVLKDDKEVTLYNENTLSIAVKAIASSYLTAKRGFKKGQPIEFTNWQSWVVDNLFELDEKGLFRYRTAVVTIPRKNGKTFLASIIVLSSLLMLGSGQEIYSAAVDRAQARIVFENVKFWVDNNPILSQVLKVTDSKNMITNVQTGSFYQALAADGSAAQGKAASLVIVDELGEWEKQSSSKRAHAFWNALTQGSGDRPESQVIVISTAGENLNDSLLGSLHKRGVKAVENPESDPAFGFFCWEADEGDNPLELETWKKANPNIAEGLMDIDFMKNSMKESIETDGFEGFLRYHLNIWQRLAGAPFISAFHWEKAVSKTQTSIEPGVKITVGMDASYNNDATAIVIQDYETGFIQLYRVWEKPNNADDTWFIPRDEVIATVHEIFAEFDVVVMYSDKRYYEQEIKEWRALNKYRVEAYSQDRTTISGAASRYRFNVINGEVTHGNQEVLTRHTMNAINDPQKGYRKATKDSREKIDALAASVMASAGRDFFKLRQKAAAEREIKTTASAFGQKRVGF